MNGQARTDDLHWPKEARGDNNKRQILYATLSDDVPQFTHACLPAQCENEVEEEEAAKNCCVDRARGYYYKQQKRNQQKSSSSFLLSLVGCPWWRLAMVCARVVFAIRCCRNHALSHAFHHWHVGFSRVRVWVSESYMCVWLNVKNSLFS